MLLSFVVSWGTSFLVIASFVALGFEIKDYPGLYTSFQLLNSIFWAYHYGNVAKVKIKELDPKKGDKDNDKTGGTS